MRHSNDVLQVPANVKNNKYKDVYGLVKAFAPGIVGMSGQIHAEILRVLWVLVDKQMRSYYESMDKEDKIGSEAFRWARAKVFNYNKTSVGRAIVLAVTPAVICLYTVLRCLARVRMTPPMAG